MACMSSPYPVSRHRRCLTGSHNDKPSFGICCTNHPTKADFQNYLSFLPPIGVLKRTIPSVDEKGKSTVIDEGTRPLDGQFRKAASYSTNDDSATQDSTAKDSEQNAQATAPHVMINHEILLSLHQKVDRNHKWVKRQFGSIL